MIDVRSAGLRKRAIIKGSITSGTIGRIKNAVKELKSAGFNTKEYRRMAIESEGIQRAAEIGQRYAEAGRFVRAVLNAATEERAAEKYNYYEKGNLAKAVHRLFNKVKASGEFSSEAQARMAVESSVIGIIAGSSDRSDAEARIKRLISEDHPKTSFKVLLNMHGAWPTR